MGVAEEWKEESWDGRLIGEVLPEALEELWAESGWELPVMSDSERSLDRSGGLDHRWSLLSTSPNLGEARAEEEERVSDELAAFHGLSGWRAGG